MLKATKVRIYPTEEEARLLDRQFGAVRFTYNKALHIIQHYYRKKGVKLKAVKDIKPLLVPAKKSRRYHWLEDFDSIALQEACRNLDKAFKYFFDKSHPARYPKFKRKHGKQTSYHCTGKIGVGLGCIIVPKIGEIKAKIHRELPGKVKSITLSKTPTGKYYASILIEDNTPTPEKISKINAELVIGLDVGITDLIVDSRGRKSGNPRFLDNGQRNLKRKQQALSRKKKGSAGRAKARMAVAKCHEKIAHQRNDFQHKQSRRLVDENQAITVETLKVKSMMKNKRLAKHIADAGWHSFITRLQYKSEQSGKHLLKLDQWFAGSKTCHACGEKQEAMLLHVRQWQCTCGSVNDRDTNAALNHKHQGIIALKAAGLVVTANGGLHKTDTLSAAA